jgi:putative sterol carrier protein
MTKAEGHGRGRSGDRPTDELFARLAAEPHQPLMGRSRGTLRFELADGSTVEQYRVTVDEGTLTVSRGKGRADTVVRADKAFFDELASGRANAMAAFVRGDLTAEGDFGLMLLFQRFFPGPPAGTKKPTRRPQAAGAHA